MTAAAEPFPVLLKPNIGGSGAGIVSFDSAHELAAAEIDFGLDGTALVQERIPAADLVDLITARAGGPPAVAAA